MCNKLEKTVSRYFSGINCKTTEMTNYMTQAYTILVYFPMSYHMYIYTAQITDIMLLILHCLDNPTMLLSFTYYNNT